MREKKFLDSDRGLMSPALKNFILDPYMQFFLKNYEILFDGKLGTMHSAPVHLEIKRGRAGKFKAFPYSCQ